MKKLRSEPFPYADEYIGRILKVIALKRSTGKLYTSNPSGLKHLIIEADVWQITRGGILIPGAILVRGLSPSDELFSKYISQWKQLPLEHWWTEYEQHFLQELESDEKLNSLRTLYKTLQAGNNVVLLCFCKDARYCHRRLVGEFFKKHDIKATELNPTKPDIPEPQQLTIFDGVV